MEGHLSVEGSQELLPVILHRAMLLHLYRSLCRAPRPTYAARRTGGAHAPGGGTWEDAAVSLSVN